MAKSKKISFIVAFAIIIAAGAIFVGAVGADSAQPKDVEEADTRVPVTTVKPERGDIVVQGEYIGTVEPGRKLTVYPKAAGEVLSVNYNIGDVVEEGDVLCQLDSTALSLSIAQTQAAVASAQAKANLNLAIAKKDLETVDFNTENGYDANLNAAKNAVESAKNRLYTANAALQSAQRTLKFFREDDLFGYQAQMSEEAAERQYRDAVTQAQLNKDAAELALEQAKENLETMTALAKEQRISANDRVAMAELNTNLTDQQIAIEKLQNDLKNYTVTAAISGVIEQRNIDPGDMASPQAPLFVISNRESITASFNVSETALEYVKIGDKVTVEKNGVSVTAIVSEISTMVDARSGLYTIEATIENPPSTWRSGSTVKVFADARKSEGTLLIPIDSIYYEGGKPYIFIAADGGIARKVFIETGVSDDKSIAVLSGLEPDADVITTWNSNLADGSGIKFAETSVS